MQKILSRVVVSAVLTGGGAVVVFCGGPIEPIPEPSARWPERPDARATTSTTTYTVALDSVALGENGGWAQYGFDLDQKITSARSRDVCTLTAGASTSVQVDGRRDGGAGVDNSFGANVVPLLQHLLSWDSPTTSASSAKLTQSIRDGLFTLQLRATGLDGTRSQTNVGLSMASFRTGRFDLEGGVPRFVPVEDWPVRSDGVLEIDASPLQSKDRFDESYVVGGTVVSGVAELTFGAVFFGWPIDLRIHHAVVVMIPAEDRVAGMIAGVLDVEEFIVGVRAIAGTFSPSWCGSAFDGVAEQLRKSADIMVDATNPPGRTCDGISFGIGFTGKRIANPIRTIHPVDAADACATVDAGTPSPTDAGSSLKCQRPSDCADAGIEAEAPACCVEVELSPSCAVASIQSTCKAKSACATNIQATCGVTATAHACASPSDCDEAAYPKCCRFQIGPTQTPYLCVSTLLAYGGQCL